MDFFNTGQLRSKIIILLLIIIVSLSSLSFYALYRSYSAYDSVILNQTHTILGLYSYNFEQALNSYEQLSYNILIDSYLQNYLSTIDNDPYHKYQQSELIEEQLLHYMQGHKHISSVNIIDNQDNIYTSGLSMPKLNYQKISAKSSQFRGSIYWTVNKNYDDKLLLIRDINKIKGKNFEKIGTAIIAINLEPFMKKILIKNIYESPITIIKYKNSFIYSSSAQIKKIPSRAELFYNKVNIIGIKNKNYLVASYKNQANNFLFIQLIPYNNIFQKLIIIRKQVLFFIVVIALISLLIGVFYSKNITKPLEKLCEIMKDVEKNNFKLPQNINDFKNNSSEINYLYKEFNIMIKRIDTLVNDKLKTKLLLVETKYKMLQSQINPHFLYNTLDSINWLARLNKQQKIADMVKSLAVILRDSIDITTYKTTIQAEINLLNNYMFIQKFRYDERLQYEYYYDQQLTDYLIPKMIIQPLVENSIKHALEPAEDTCIIKLFIKKNNDKLKITVTDTGLGISSDKIAELNDTKFELKKNSVGIKNIVNRLEFLYKNKFKFKIDSAANQGTTVSITLPLEKGNFEKIKGDN
ncbi:two-component system, sensor histidine kinase YesM [Halanaerobium salsuginis]|jgi:two-component system sensor histidine kinase YesM|uniref:Two-component system, sensor histidine kinase YesM n=2 Tax=Halanaerobium salsuginis TaxID=29563 RepID=A0A1I4MAM4_9FIRM|nr:two-component system, sensor histidine kinase YesM [Halanaerobium salsuginis]